MKFLKMWFRGHLQYLFLFVVILNTISHRLGAAMKIDSDGGYTDVVIRIASDGSVPEETCPVILKNLKVSLTHAYS